VELKAPIPYRLNKKKKDEKEGGGGGGGGKEKEKEEALLLTEILGVGEVADDSHGRQLIKVFRFGFGKKHS